MHDERSRTEQTESDTGKDKQIKKKELADQQQHAPKDNLVLFLKVSISEQLISRLII